MWRSSTSRSIRRSGLKPWPSRRHPKIARTCSPTTRPVSTPCRWLLGASRSRSRRRSGQLVLSSFRPGIQSARSRSRFPSVPLPMPEGRTRQTSPKRKWQTLFSIYHAPPGFPPYRRASDSSLRRRSNVQSGTDESREAASRWASIQPTPLPNRRRDSIDCNTR